MIADDDSRKCWATREIWKDRTDIPCNHQGIPPLYLCETHDRELRDVQAATSVPAAP